MYKTGANQMYKSGANQMYKTGANQTKCIKPVQNKPNVKNVQFVEDTDHSAQIIILKSLYLCNNKPLLFQTLTF